ncbi:thermonuclease family protein [Halobacillus yeomjeoni]|uniref:Thermonuclease family protein n=1 Tax=Halobacillus yeomjeoni TaxID=311194 RepID=A0A931HT10_9BACI|nr:thermonuclease family protein [Halobacillus yeomjeoni]MBH0228829.1 thermonuclease family protein [Halobacillus yeomjeoni]
MAGCFTIIAIIILLALVISFPIASIGLIIGVAIAVWGFKERSINKELGAKSKKPITIVLVGFFVVLMGLSAQGASTSPEDVAETSEKAEEVSSSSEEEKEPESEERKAAAAEEEKQTEADAQEKQDKAEEEKKAEEQAKAEAKAKEEEEAKAKAEAEKKKNAPNATVTRVVDGDTLKVNMNGKEEEIRLLLIDTPETVHPNEPVQPFGPEASQFVKDTLSGQQVRVQVGKEARDKYGRMLAYVYIGEETIQEKLLRKGLARTAYLYNDLTLLDRFHNAQANAMSSGIGVWSIPGYAHKDHDHGYHYEEEKTVPKKETAPPSSSNTNSGGGNAIYYKNCTAVRNAGADPIRRGEPGYGSHLDRDGDGIACE